MKLIAILVSLAIALLTSSCASLGDRGDRLHITATANTAGPYGDYWTINVLEHQDGSGANLRFVMFTNRGKVKGDIFLDKDQVSSFKAQLANSDYFNLPKDIHGPSIMLHTPELSLNACLGNKCHNVRVDNANTAGDSTDGKRFMALWSILVKPMPLSPSWSGT